MKFSLAIAIAVAVVAIPAFFVLLTFLLGGWS